MLLGALLSIFGGVALLILGKEYGRWYPPLEAAVARIWRFVASRLVRCLSVEEVTVAPRTVVTTGATGSAIDASRLWSEPVGAPHGLSLERIGAAIVLNQPLEALGVPVLVNRPTETAGSSVIGRRDATGATAGVVRWGSPLDAAGVVRLGEPVKAAGGSLVIGQPVQNAGVVVPLPRLQAGGIVRHLRYAGQGCWWLAHDGSTERTDRLKGKDEPRAGWRRGPPRLLEGSKESEPPARLGQTARGG